MVIALVAVVRVSGASTPLDLGKHGLGKGRVRLAHGDVSTGVVIAKSTCKLHNGQPCEGDIASVKAVAHHGLHGIHLATLDAGEHKRFSALHLGAVNH